MTVVDPETIGFDTDLGTYLLNLVAPYEESSDPNRRTHIVNPPMNTHIWRPGMETQQVVDIARATGQEITALCGYTWIPKHNPEKFDVCEKCMTIAGDIMEKLGE
jgi:hypothetical protein